MTLEMRCGWQFCPEKLHTDDESRAGRTEALGTSDVTQGALARALFRLSPAALILDLTT